eukprot:CAMPEP_0198356330 /NCGR_PEP_ID=MMETSP1450-20131203/122399_1 /TAXON_ID=753684 ORGANISM="Madagascaria erythrocladiodes, Strain CCMP3234" /NCGR_SAMPLE_ID=MMETSP1450 /ASSEMBLY_ACC=CAM_ASM_001115 /LENGTH=58 /DNA_ID=CAMNT_0044062805 /DNA_START=93 /DNA_END=266 /DNA_ORIENTATION=+
MATVAEFLDYNDSIVELNVGGTVFTTRASTLLGARIGLDLESAPSFFRGLLQDSRKKR